MGEARHECGICGIYSKEGNDSVDVPALLVSQLSILQARGQRSAGIVTYRPKKREEMPRKVLSPFKGLGRVSEVFGLHHENKFQKILQACSGVAGIGHTRYSTSGSEEFARDETQPFIRRHARAWKMFALSFNGNLANYDELKKMIEDNGLLLQTNVDTEILINLFSSALKRQGDKDGDESVKPDLFEIIRDVVAQVDGAYNLVLLFADGDLLIFRDPLGIHPLTWGENDKYYSVASESVALEKIGIKKFFDVLPGEAIIFSKDGVKRKQVIQPKPKYCQFEYVYFARQGSVMNGLNVKEVRQRLGKELAYVEPLKDKLDLDYVVVPAPKTAITAAEIYSEVLGLRMRMAVEKIENERGFINGLKERNRIINGGYEISREDVKGKKVIIVDDSIVRGETSEKLVSAIREKGATEVHLRSTEPPIRHPCYYGIDFADRSQLIACRGLGINAKIEEIEEVVAKSIGADSVKYLPMESLIRGIGLPKENVCSACLDGDYPTFFGQKRSKEE
jgi:amidophosphoribosyltransferase